MEIIENIVLSASLICLALGAITVIAAFVAMINIEEKSEAENTVGKPAVASGNKEEKSDTQNQTIVDYRI